MLRAGEGALGGVEMPLRDAHRPSTASTSSAIDIHTVRYRHRYRPMRMARDGRGDKEENSFSDGRCHRRHQSEAASSRYGFCILSSPYIMLGVVAFAIGLLIFLLR